MSHKPPIRDGAYAARYPRRVNVFRESDSGGGDAWNVWRGWNELGTFPTHAEAIAEADRLTHPTPPNLSAHGARLMDDAARAFREGR